MGNAAGIEGHDQESDPDKTGAEAISSVHVLNLTRKQAEDIAEFNQVSVSDVYLLYKRFHLLKPDRNGFISRKVFEVEPYISDPFCVQLWKRLSGERLDEDKISFTTFSKTMFWWQQAPMEMKLKLLFSWMKDVEGLTANTFSKVIGYTLPQYSQEETQKLAKDVLQIMTGSGEEEKVDLKLFLRWFSKLPQDDLKQALDFNIASIN